MTTTCEILFWRDIPAQVKARAGRQRASRQLSERFQQAIDVAAMHSGKSGTDEYLAEWKTRAMPERDETPEQAAEILAAELERTYTPERLAHLATNGGIEG